MDDHELAAWLAAVQGTSPPRRIDRVRAVVLAGDHGVSTDGVSAYPREVTAAMVDAIAPAPRQYDPKTSATMALIEQLCARTDLTRITVEKPGFRLALETDQ